MINVNKHSNCVCGHSVLGKRSGVSGRPCKFRSTCKRADFWPKLQVWWKVRHSICPFTSRATRLAHCGCLFIYMGGNLAQWLPLHFYCGLFCPVATHSLLLWKMFHSACPLTFIVDYVGPFDPVAAHSLLRCTIWHSGCPVTFTLGSLAQQSVQFNGGTCPGPFKLQDQLLRPDSPKRSGTVRVWWCECYWDKKAQIAIKTWSKPFYNLHVFIVCSLEILLDILYLQ